MSEPKPRVLDGRLPGPNGAKPGAAWFGRVLTGLIAFASLAGAAPSLLIRGGHRFESASGRMVPSGVIVVTGDRITTMADELEPGGLPAGTPVLDARGLFLIPGLIDAHVHLVHILQSAGVTAEEILPLFLAHGVTRLRDVGDEMGAQRRLAEFARQHPESAPGVTLGSPLLDGRPPYHPLISAPITDPARIPAWVEEMSDLGVQTFKLYVGAERAVGRAVIREAHRRGKWVTAHLAWGYTPQEAVEDGIDSLEHIGSILEFVLPPGSPRWPPPVERSRLPAATVADLERRLFEIKAHLDLHQPAVSDLVRALARGRVAVAPTLTVYRNWMLLRDQPEVLQHPDLQVVPARLRDNWIRSARQAALDPATAELRRRQFDKMKELTDLLSHAGVELLAGTDTPVQFCPPGAAMHQELELLVEAGLSPAAALIAATRSNARAIGRAGDVGAIETGRVADIVLLTANPLEDIRHTRRIHRVIHAGVLVDPAALRRAVPAQ